MKKTLFIMMLSVLSVSAWSQSNLVKGSHTVSLKYGGGQYSFGKYGQAEFGINYQEKLLVRFGVSYERAEIGSTLLTVGRVNVDQSFNILDLKDKLYLNGIAGAYFGYEGSESDRNPISTMNFVFGANLGLELDYYLTNRLSVKAEFLQYYMKNSVVSPWFYTGTIGLSYVIN